MRFSEINLNHLIYNFEFILKAFLVVLSFPRSIFVQ